MRPRDPGPRRERLVTALSAIDPDLGAGRILAAGVLLTRWALGHPGRVREWRRIARTCGLTNVREVRHLGLTRRVEADAGWLRVVFTSRPPRLQDGPIRGTILVHGLANGLHAPTAEGRLGGLDVTKRTADEMPPIGGPPLLLCALLDPAARPLVSALFERRIPCADGTVRDWTCWPWIEGRTLYIAYLGTLFDDALPATLRAARCLVSTEDAAGMAAANLQRETDDGLRVHILRTLIAEAPAHPATVAAVRGALTDAADTMRVEAAVASGDEGRAVLRALAASDDTSEPVLARAITALGAELPSQDVHALLSKAIARRRTRVSIACVELLGARGPEETDALVRALSCADRGVVTAAAQALRWHGNTREAVIALRDAQALARGDPDLAEAVRHAVTAIQLRLEKAGVGQLSVAGGDTGAVSLADDPQGRVTLDRADEPPQS